jgi:hypothetical protein
MPKAPPATVPVFASQCKLAYAPIHGSQAQHQFFPALVFPAPSHPGGVPQPRAVSRNAKARKALQRSKRMGPTCRIRHRRHPRALKTGRKRAVRGAQTTSCPICRAQLSWCAATGTGGRRPTQRMAPWFDGMKHSGQLHLSLGGCCDRLRCWGRGGR